MKIQVIIIYVVIMFMLHVIPFGTDVAFDSIQLLDIRVDYLIHMIFFLPWMGLVKFSLTGNSSKTGQSSRSESIHRKLHTTIRRLTFSPFFWLLIGILFATVAEVVQYWLSYRSFNLMDLLSGITGLVLGSIVYVDRIFRS